MAAGLAAVLAAGSARADSPNNFAYIVNPLVQPADNGTSPATFTNPFCSSSTLVCYTPKDIKTAYNYPSGLTGAGQTIVIVDAYGSPTAAADLAAFDTQFGIPGPPGGLQIVCPAGCPNTTLNNKPNGTAGWGEESSLDVQWAHAMAPGATLVLAVAPNPHGDAINSVEAKIFADPAYRGAIVSQSFGIPEYAVGNGNNAQILQAHRNYELARANGITVLASTGDNGATNGASFGNAGYPASDPNVLAVGGTQGHPYYNGRASAGSQQNPLPACRTTFLGQPCTVGLATVQCSSATTCPTIGYGGEETWNENFLPAATGGAASLIFAAPAFQSGDGSGSSARTIPDISYNAAVSGGVLTYLGFLGPGTQGFYIFGGTSAASPQMASVIALANQLKGSTLGYVNDKVYSIAESGAYSSAFHDITIGNNQLLGTPFGNSAGTGYDLATGWGTPNVANFVASLAGA